MVLVLLLTAFGCTPRDPGTIAQANEKKIEWLESKLLDLERENTDLMRAIDQMEDDIVTCKACVLKCDLASEKVDEVRVVIESLRP